MFNVDESNMALKKRKVVVSKGSRCSHCVETGSKKHITVNAGESAAGTALPPMRIYKQSFSSPYKAEGIPGALSAKSTNGYMDEVLSFNWFMYPSRFPENAIKIFPINDT